ncbi:unnamed protein product, partial [Polarella glacialis]
DGLSAFVSSLPIAAGEEVTVSYSDVVLGCPRCLRQAFLFHRFGFWCSCCRCAGGGESWEGPLRAYLQAARDDEAFRRNGSHLCKIARACRYSPQPSSEHWMHAFPCILPLLALQSGLLVLGGLAARRVRRSFVTSRLQLARPSWFIRVQEGR